MPVAKRIRKLFMSASEPDPVGRRWCVRVWCNDKTGEIHATEYHFWSEVKHVDEAFELLYSCGFACVRKDYQGYIQSAGNLNVRLSTGEL